MSREDLQLLHYLLDMLLSQPSMFADDESFNRAVAVQERLGKHLADTERTERRRQWRASLRTGAGDE